MMCSTFELKIERFRATSSRASIFRQSCIFAQTSYTNLANIIVAVMLILNQRRRSLRLSCPRARHANSMYARRRRRNAIYNTKAHRYASARIGAQRDSKRAVSRVGCDNWLAEIYFARITHPTRICRKISGRIHFP